MDHGVLQQYGSRDELYNHPANRFVANFIGSPSMNFIDCTLAVKGDRIYLDASDFKLDVSRFADKIQKKAASEELIMGIRPENVAIQAKPGSENAVESKVFMTEPIGSKTIVTLSVGEILVKSITPGTFRADIGSRLWMEFDMEKLHVFDKKTEEALL
jgi:multiple sugar transport system ATP-binding protein